MTVNVAVSLILIGGDTYDEACLPHLLWVMLYNKNCHPILKDFDI
jgi:hypothetical protein